MDWSSLLLFSCDHKWGQWMTIWGRVPCVKHHIFMQKWTPFIAENCNTKERKQMSYIPYAVAIVKRIAGCTENQGSWPQANRQHVVGQWSGNIEYTITEARHYSSNSQDGLKVPCTLCFSGDAKLGRSYKLDASNIDGCKHHQPCKICHI